MKRIVTEAFTLNLPEGQQAFSVGDELSGAEAEHWYAQAYSKEVAEAAAPAAEVVAVPAVEEVVEEAPVEPEAAAPAKAGKKK